MIGSLKTILILMILAVPAAALAHSYKQEGVNIGHPWAMPAAKGEDSIAFMPLLNTGPQDDELIAAQSDAVEKVVFYKGEKTVSAIPLMVNKPVGMSLVGYHLKLTGLRHNLTAEDQVPVTLTFKQAGSIKVNWMIQDGLKHAH